MEPVHAADAAVGTAGHGSFDESSAEYVVKAGRAYARGEQVFLCYGSYTNLELLEHYGFLLPHNPHEEVLTPSDAWPCSTAGAGGTGKAFLHPCAPPATACMCCMLVASAHTLTPRCLQLGSPRGACCCA